jgi:hypothetical protein
VLKVQKILGCDDDQDTTMHYTKYGKHSPVFLSSRLTRLAAASESNALLAGSIAVNWH